MRIVRVEYHYSERHRYFTYRVNKQTIKPNKMEQRIAAVEIIHSFLSFLFTCITYFVISTNRIHTRHTNTVWIYPINFSFAENGVLSNIESLYVLLLSIPSLIGMCKRLNSLMVREILDPKNDQQKYESSHRYRYNYKRTRLNLYAIFAIYCATTHSIKSSNDFHTMNAKLCTHSWQKGSPFIV